MAYKPDAAADRIADESFRISIVNGWDARFDKLSSRKKNPKNMKDCASDTKLNYTALSRYRNGKHLPEWEVVKKIQVWLKKNGV